MVTWTIQVDESTDRALRAVAAEYGGDLGKALCELLAVRDGADLMPDEFEEENEPILRRQLERSIEDIQAGRVVDWNEIKSRHNL